jgi:uncharacterized protein DUF6677
MANANTEAFDSSTAQLTGLAVFAPIIGWLVPGAGHLVQKKWVRGALLMISVLTMFILGIMMDGKIYSMNFGDVLDVLGFIGDLGSGVLYFGARTLHFGRGAINIATADYGTKFIIVAGLLNVISAVDAYHIAIGKKP